jgi:NMD protein affecting ribosome stability and mRNA decay
MESSIRCGICYSANVGQDWGMDLQVCNDCGAHQVQGGWQAREAGKRRYKGMHWPRVETKDGFVPTRESTKSPQSPSAHPRIKK